MFFFLIVYFWDRIWLYIIKAGLKPALFPAHSPAKVKDICNYEWLVYMGKVLYVCFVHKPVHALVGARSLPGISSISLSALAGLAGQSSLHIFLSLPPSVGILLSCTVPHPSWRPEIQMLVLLLEYYNEYFPHWAISLASMVPVSTLKALVHCSLLCIVLHKNKKKNIDFLWTEIILWQYCRAFRKNNIYPFQYLAVPSSHWILTLQKR